MAIKIKELELLADRFAENQRYVFKDLSLDLSKTKIESPGLELPTPGTDIKASFDLEAIGNSLVNLFNTVPGQRFLFPNYGLNLKRYIFSPITVNNAESIGNLIFDGIKKFESRVIPQNVSVVGVPDENCYKITIIVQIPLRNISTQIDFVFDLRKETFISLPVKNI